MRTHFKLVPFFGTVHLHCRNKSLFWPTFEDTFHLAALFHRRVDLLCFWEIHYEVVQEAFHLLESALQLLFRKHVGLVFPHFNHKVGEQKLSLFWLIVHTFFDHLHCYFFVLGWVSKFLKAQNRFAVVLNLDKFIQRRIDFLRPHVVLH